MTIALLKPEAVDSLRTFFPDRREPNYALGQLFSTYANLHGARHLYSWARQGTDNSQNLSDLLIGTTGGEIVSGSPTRGVEGLMTYGNFDGVNDMFICSDSASHTYYYSLTIIAWVRFHEDAIGTATQMGVYTFWRTSTAARAFNLRKTTSDKFEFLISDNGTDEFSVIGDTTLIANQWYFVAGQFDPSTALNLWVSNPTTHRLVHNENTTSIPAGIVAPVPAGQAIIGARNSGAGTYADFLMGDMLLLWTGGHPAATPENQVTNAFQVSRPLLSLI